MTRYQEKLGYVEELIRRGATPGERDAARRIAERLRKKIKSKKSNSTSPAGARDHDGRGCFRPSPTEQKDIENGIEKDIPDKAWVILETPMDQWARKPRWFRTLHDAFQWAYSHQSANTPHPIPVWQTDYPLDPIIYCDVEKNNDLLWIQFCEKINEFLNHKIHWLTLESEYRALT
jgi:hypothetical protein